MVKTKTRPTTEQTDNGQQRRPTPVRDKLIAGIATLKASLVGRDDEVDLLFTAAVAGEHPFFWGDPGVAKSKMIDGFAGLIDGPKFSYLLTKFTDPAELFGPVDLPAMKAGEFKRVVGGMLPEACLAFLDEVK